MFGKSSNPSIHEDEKLSEMYNRPTFKMQINRVKRIIQHTKQKIRTFDEVLNFKFPRISLLFYALLILGLIFLNISDLVSLIILALIVVILVNDERLRTQRTKMLSFLE